MEPEEFRENVLEEIPFNQLKPGDIFSFATGIRRHSFIREVTQKTPDRIYYECIDVNARGLRDYGTTERNGLVTRIVRGREYDPTQQPYEEDDI